ncbi:MAG: thiol:disulfide interchange protein, partial [Melioribacteraceae bacterium]
MKAYKFLHIIYLLILFPFFNSVGKNVDAELITNVKSIQPGKEFWVALKLTAKQDWHTYWRNPGDSGLPTTIEWNLPEGFKHSEIFWTYPEVFVVEGIANFGYDKEELLLIKIIPPKNLQTNKSATLKAKANWLACRVECVP